MGRVVGVEEVASGEWRVTSLRKKEVPPDKTRDSRHLSGARRCARQGGQARNDNSRGVGALVMKVA